MKQNHKVSIIIPIYNVGEYFHHCIDSIITQSYRNIEIIIVNDGSTDGSEKQAEVYARKDQRIKVIHQPNAGVSVARNTGIKNSIGDYICFSDADDILQPDYIEYLLKLCIANNVDISVCAEVFTPFMSSQLDDDVRIISGEDAAAEILYGRITVGCYSKMFKRSFLIENAIQFLPGVKIGEGFNFNVLAFCSATNVAISQHKVYTYRLDNTNSAMSKFCIKKCQEAVESINLIRENLLIKSDNLLKAVYFAKYTTIASMYDWFVLSNAKRSYPNEYEKYKKEVRRMAIGLLTAPTSFKIKIATFIRSINPWIWAIMRAYARRQRL
jgi:glycosyltransferase